MNREDFYKLNNQKLSLYIPGYSPEFEFRCALIEWMPRLAYDSDEPVLLVHFDWEDENRSGSPIAIETAMNQFNYAKNHKGFSMEMKQLGTNSVIVQNIKGYNIKINSINRDAKY